MICPLCEQELEIEQASSFKIRLTEFILLLLIGIITVIFNPPLPLLSIPFIVIIAIRNIFILLEDSKKTKITEVKEIK